MNSIDILLAYSFEKHISENLGTPTTLILKNRLNEKYGKSLSEIIHNDVGKFEIVLGELIGKTPSKVMMKNIMQDVCRIPKPTKSMTTKLKKLFKLQNNEDVDQYSQDLHNNVIEIIDDDFKTRILGAYNDDQKAAILIITSKTPLTTDEIIESVSNFDKQITFEKIDELITEGLLIPLGDDEFTILNTETKYYNIVKSINVAMNDNKNSVRIVVTDKISNSVLIDNFN